MKKFLAETGMSATQLAHEAGLTPSLVTRIISGARSDMTSTNADAVRDAMARLLAERNAGQPDADPSARQSTDSSAASGDPAASSSGQQGADPSPAAGAPAAVPASAHPGAEPSPIVNGRLAVPPSIHQAGTSA